MEAESQRPKGREDAISALNAAIGALNHAKISNIAPAKTVFASVGVLLTTIRDSMVNRPDYVELGLSCADVCRAIERGTKGKRPDELGRSVYDGINRLTSTVTDIQNKLVKWDRRNVISQRLRAKNDKKTIATWRSDLDKILQVFNELAVNANVADSATRHDVADPHTVVSAVQNDVVNTCSSASDTHRNAPKRPKDVGGQERMTHASAPGESPPPPPRGTHGKISEIRHDVARARAIVSELEHDVTTARTVVSDMRRALVKDQEGSDGKNVLTQTSTVGESPPPAPRAVFGRGELVERIVGLVENFTPIALIGPGGIGKTSIALTVLHHDHVRQRFGDSRRFIRCDQFTTSCAHFLSRLSEVIGAGIESPKALAAIRPFLSSKEVFIVLDNAESILDPQGVDAQEIYAVVEELSQFSNICLCITSRLSIIPPDCETLNIPTLSIEAARDAFYRIYKSGEQPHLVGDILGQLDFHPLSITLLATVAHHSQWDTGRLTREWERRRTGVLQTRHNKSLAATIELSLASPLFQQLGPDARALLEVVAFFPQGVNENNLDWLFPTIPDGAIVFDNFCTLSLTHRSNGFVTMLAPLRDYLSPKDPKISSLLCATKEHYFTRMSVDINPSKPNFGETRWIRSEDVNVEHLLDVFTTIEGNSDSVWDACANFMSHLHWHKNRLTILKPKIEGLPDDHRSKPRCLFEFSLLLYSVGHWVECKQLLTRALKLWRERGDDRRVAQTLLDLSEANRKTGLPKEGIQLAEEALEIYERLDDTVEQARCLRTLAWLLVDDGQLSTAEETASRAIELLPEKGEEFLVCESHRALCRIYESQGKTEKAIHHNEVALGIASSFNWHDSLFWIHYNLAGLLRIKSRFDDAQAQVDQAKSHAGANVYQQSCVMEEQAWVWCEQGSVEEARSEALRAADVFEKLGAAMDVERCRRLLRDIQEKQNSRVVSGQPGSDSQGAER